MARYFQAFHELSLSLALFVYTTLVASDGGVVQIASLHLSLSKNKYLCIRMDMSMNIQSLIVLKERVVCSCQTLTSSTAGTGDMLPSALRLTVRATQALYIPLYPKSWP